MTTATKMAAESRPSERWVSVERLGDKFVLNVLNPVGQVRFQLTRVQAQALIDRLSAELRRVKSGQPQQEDEEWLEPEIM